MAELYIVVTGNPAVYKYVMSDADHGQRNAFEGVVVGSASSQPQYLMCFFYVMTNVKKYTSGMSVSARRLAYLHVYRIHYARNEVALQARIQEALTA
jgi:hypothetical protein